MTLPIPSSRQDLYMDYLNGNGNLEDLPQIGEYSSRVDRYLFNLCVNRYAVENEFATVAIPSKFIQVNNTVNLFDKSKATVGYYKSTDGAFVNDVSLVSSDFIPVTEGNTYRHTTTAHNTFYNASKEFVSGTGGNKFTIPTGQNITHMIITVATSGKDIEMCVQGDNLPILYVPYYNISLDSSIYNTGKLSKIQGFQRTLKNFFNKDTVMPGYYKTGGVYSTDSSYYCSDFIPVTEGKTYFRQTPGWASYWDINKNFINAVGSNTYTVPAGQNIAYIRISVEVAKLNTEMFVEGTQAPMIYIPYSYYNIDTNTIDKRSFGKWYGKKWNAMGDSITEYAYINYGLIVGDNKGFATVNNYGIPGSAIAKRDGATGHETDHICDRVLTMDATADLITVFAGTNDGAAPLGTSASTDKYTFYGAMNVMCTNLLTAYPGKTIAVFTPIQRTANSQLADRVRIIKEVCAKYSIPCLDLNAVAGLHPDIPALNTAFYIDGLHPNLAGHQVISKAISGFLDTLI